MAINIIIKAIDVRRIRGLQRTSGLDSSVIGKWYRRNSVIYLNIKTCKYVKSHCSFFSRKGHTSVLYAWPK